MQIAALTGRADLAPQLARWHYAEFAHLYTDTVWNESSAVAELEAMAEPGATDATWVAFDGDGRGAGAVLGSVSLIATDDLAGFEHLSPWLASLFVAPQARSHGVGAALVDVVLAAAAERGHPYVYLFSAGQEQYYLDRGWHVIDAVDQHGYAATVMARATTTRGARRSVSSHWCTDPDTNGAYSYLRVGATPADRDRLAGPILPGLWFAGEATWSEHPATMHGAWFSGERAAHDVLASDDGGDVLVIGAGLAGIAAARTLTAAGRSVVVAEASDHPGGRATTDTSLGIPLPLGGAWLHGTEGHPLRPFVTTTPEDWTFGVTFVTGHGALHDEQRRQAVALRGEFDAMFAENPSDMTADVALAEALAAHADADPLVKAAVAEWVSIEIENLYAAPLDDFAPSAGYELYELPGDDQIITSSLAPVFRQLVDPLDVRYSTRLSQLTFDGERWHADSGLVAEHVIVTASVAALKAGRIGFEPGLPDDVLAALDHLGVGPVTKLFATYDSVWWPTDPRPIRVVGDVLRQAVDMTPLTGTPTLCWFATGDTARQIETMTEHDRLALVDRVARDCGLTAWDA